MMTIDLADATILIEPTRPMLGADLASLGAGDEGPTLEGAMREAALGQTGKDGSDGQLQRPSLFERHEAAIPDLGLSPRFQTARSMEVDDNAALTPLHKFDDPFSKSNPSMAASYWEQNDLDENQDFDYDYIDAQLLDWYDWDVSGGPGDDLSEKLDEWGRMISDWINSIIPGSDVIVTGPSGTDLSNDYSIIFHQDGSGLISLFHDGMFVTGLEAATPQTATLLITVTGYEWSISIPTPWGGVEGSVGGGPSMTYYFRPGR